MTPVNGLPAGLAISDRSRKFYDSTFKWDSDGFTDEHGVYRVFDCLDPLARAPTPMPPMFSNDEEDDQMDVVINEPIQVADKDLGTISGGAAGPDTPCPKPSGSTSEASILQSAGSIRRVAIDFLANTQRNQTTDHEGLDKQTPRDSPVVNIEDTVSAPEQEGFKEGLNRTIELLEEPLQAKIENNMMKMPETPPESPVKANFGGQTISPASASSSLSSVPSNLSEQDNDIDIKIKDSIANVQDTPSLPSTPSKTAARSKTKASTRGVAQKVTKGAKRASSSKASPPKRKDNSIEDFTLRELHSGAFMRTRSLRRSARQGESKDS